MFNAEIQSMPEGKIATFQRNHFCPGGQSNFNRIVFRFIIHYNYLVWKRTNLFTNGLQGNLQVVCFIQVSDEDGEEHGWLPGCRVASYRVAGCRLLVTGLPSY